MIGRSDEEMWDKYVEEYAKENEQIGTERNSRGGRRVYEWRY